MWELLILTKILWDNRLLWIHLPQNYFLFILIIWNSQLLIGVYIYEISLRFYLCQFLRTIEGHVNKPFNSECF